jgi:ABC-type transporter Mla MlaB component
MLRITDLTGESDRLLLRVEGRLIGPWVTVLRRHCRKLLELGSVDLDLTGVSFVDPAGLALLRDLVGRDVRLKACSAFVSELLNQKAPR